MPSGVHASVARVECASRTWALGDVRSPARDRAPPCSSRLSCELKSCALSVPLCPRLSGPGLWPALAGSGQPLTAACRVKCLSAHRSMCNSGLYTRTHNFEALAAAHATKRRFAWRHLSVSPPPAVPPSHSPVSPLTGIYACFRAPGHESISEPRQRTVPFGATRNLEVAANARHTYRLGHRSFGLPNDASRIESARPLGTRS